MSSDAEITFEPIQPDLALGSEFIFRENGVAQVHQAKRQISGQYHWTPKALAGQDVWTSAMHHVERGREFHFVSSSSFGELVELTERSREADDLETFTELSLSGELRKIFDALVRDQFARADVAWLTLRSMYFIVCNERMLARDNEVLASQLLRGATGAGIAAAIGDALLEKMGKKLSRTEILASLEPQITPLSVAERATIYESVESQAARWKRSIERELLYPPIERTETGLIVDALASKRLVLVSGAAGTGKSAVLESVMARLSAAGQVVLPFRLDRLNAFDTTMQIGVQLDLEGSPVEALARAADGGEAVLLIDQLDAVSLASGRTPDNFDAVVDLIEEALASPKIRVLLACRAFDIENDPRIRTFARHSHLAELLDTVSVELLSDDAVDAAVTRMGLNPTKLATAQRTLLQTPFNLVLLSGVAPADDALDFDSIDALFDAFWSRKSERATRSRPTLRFSEVVSRVAAVMSERQTLSVPREVLDDGGLLRDAQVLASEHVLAIGDNRISFFHEAFFDYAFARMWMARSDTIVDFLTASEQELFRRAQVRQVLQYLQPRDPKRFRAEVATLLGSSYVRFHIKETVLAVMADMMSPTAEDVELMIEVAATHPTWEERLWQQLRRPQWFTQFDAVGHIGSWLTSNDEELRSRALNFMTSSIRDAPEVVTAELTAHADSPHYDLWVRWLVRFADLGENRKLFDLLLDAVRRGAFDNDDHGLWLSVNQLGAKAPKWAIELLRARLIDHHGALALEDGKVRALNLRDYGLTQIVRESGEREPLLFAETFVPYLQNVMAATARPMDLGDDPIRDSHFAVRFPEHDAEERELDDALLTATARALEAASINTPAKVQPLLDALSADPHDSAQYLLYRTMTAAPATFAEQASDLLSQGGRRLECGYASDSHWVARSLVAAIAPLLSDESHQRLENVFRDLKNEWERPRWRGRVAFSFLSALDAERLTRR
ncbi:nSTAND1 domain-containing NTPase [Nocardioides aurantiacus]|uniref:nSTAND1 domain-containing NTPase n=1 Tax=Nocardioides aurantiacus TaxID=86796 RepID=UPI00403F6392